jgi:hypothetical protein
MVGELLSFYTDRHFLRLQRGLRLVLLLYCSSRVLEYTVLLFFVLRAGQALVVRKLIGEWDGEDGGGMSFSGFVLWYFFYKNFYSVMYIYF